IGESPLVVPDPPAPTSSKRSHCSCEHRFHSTPCDGHASLPPSVQEANVSQDFLGFCYAFMPAQRTALVDENNSEFRQRWLVSLLSGVYSHHETATLLLPVPFKIGFNTTPALLFMLGSQWS